MSKTLDIRDKAFRKLSGSHRRKRDRDWRRAKATKGKR
jgi:hypothetical protein